MVRMGKHIYGLNFFDFIAALCQKAQVTLLSFGVAGDIDYLFRREGHKRRQEALIASCARRIHEKHVAVFTGVCHIYHEVACIGTDEADIFHTV